MHKTRKAAWNAVLSVALLACATAPAWAAETESSIARGARLYDKWREEDKATQPRGDPPAYPTKGGHATGIKGINAAAGKDQAVIAALLRDRNLGCTDAQLSAKDSAGLDLFVAKGQGKLGKYVQADNKSTGDAGKGEVLFNTICTGCHVVDGKKLEDAPLLGSVAGNGAERMHKLQSGQAGEAVPALRALDPQISADIALQLTKLPTASAMRWGVGAPLAMSALDAVVGVVFWGGFDTAMEATHSMEFCISCHEMKDDVYPGYLKSPHYRNASGVRAIFYTPQKFEVVRAELAEHVWAAMIANDLHECRIECHKGITHAALKRSDWPNARSTVSMQGD